MSEQSHLAVYRFGPDAAFEGGLVAAVERMPFEGNTKLLDALFVRHEALSDGVEAVDLASAGGGATFASLLDFRLDPIRRRAITERTLGDHRGGVPRPLIEQINAALEPGAAIFAILHTGQDPSVVKDAVARSGGRIIADEHVEARTLADAHQPFLMALTDETREK